MAAVWNSTYVKEPPTGRCLYDSSEIKTVGNLKAIADLLNEISSTINGNRVLQKEIKYLSTFVYKSKGAFRNDKQFKSMQKIRKCLRRFLAMDIPRLTDKLYREMKSSFHSAPGSLTTGNTPYVDLPSRQMFEFVLLRLQGCSRLVLQMLQYCQEGVYYSLQKIYLGHCLPMVLALSSSISAIWKSFLTLLIECTKWYQTLYCFTYKLKKVGADWLTPGNSLPENLEEWLGQDYQDVLKQGRLSAALHA